jgi:Cu/Ag efflux protein CusF
MNLMKTLRAPVMALLVLLSSAGIAHAEGMDGMSMKEAQVHHGTGTVQKVDVANGRVTVAHGAINSLRWPPMTMGFAVQDKKLLERLSAGEKIDFDLVQSAQDRYVITRIIPAK